MAAHCHTHRWHRWVPPLLALALLGLLCASVADAQPTFKKYPGNPVLFEGSSGAWDDKEAFPGAVVKRGSVYHLWYLGWDGTAALRYLQCGYATSTDGIHWVKHPTPVLPVGPPGSWDSYDATASNVLLDGPLYKTWYSGYGGNSPFDGKISYARAAQETSWTKSNRVVLGPGPAGTWDGQAVIWACVQPATPPNRFSMWYTGLDGSRLGTTTWGRYKIGYATATDETTWVKYPYNPVLSAGPAGAWDEGFVTHPRVVIDSATGIYHMFYTGTDLLSGVTRIGYARSLDGIAWTKLPSPVLSPGPPASWDEKGVWAGWVIIQRDTFHLWYGGTNGATWRGGYATMPVSHVAPPTVRRVPRYYPTIQAAIDASHFGDTVLVYEGTYRENIRFRGKAIVVGSLWLMDKDTAHVAKTIIDGSTPTKPDSGSTVMLVDGEDTTSVLAGFTITGGTGTSYTALAWPYRLGGGVYCLQSGARITNNVITRNSITGPGALGGGVAAVAVDTSDRFVILEQNYIGENLVVATTLDAITNGGGGAAFDGVSGRVTGNIFERDTVRAVLAAGGGIAVMHNTLILPSIYAAGNIFRENAVLTTASSSALGGGMAVWRSTSGTLTGNLFERNIARSGTGTGFGGALAVWDGIAGAGKKLISNNRFIQNQAGGGLLKGGGGGLYLAGAVADLTGNMFSANATEGTGGGAMLDRSAFLFANNIVAGNFSNFWGGGIHVSQLPSADTGQAIVNNTFFRNVAREQGGGIVFGWTEASAVLLNNILWQDSAWNAREIYTDGNVTLNIHYCNVQGGVSEGTHNINLDPLFVPGDPLLNLSLASPCIGAGTDSFQVADTWYRAPSCDCDGHPRARPSGTRPDIGAQEEQTILISSIDTDGSTPWVYSLSQNYPNPFNPTTVIGYQLPSAGEIRLVVYDLLGREIKVLVNEEMPAGTHTVEFDGEGLSSGVYFYRLTAGPFVQSKRMVLLK